MSRRTARPLIEPVEPRTLLSVSFLPAVQSQLGSLDHLAVGDFTGNGVADLVARNPETNRVHLYPGLGNGQFVPTAISAPIDAGPNVVQLVAADVNRDGRLDLVAVNGRDSANTGGVSVLLGQGGLSFAPAIRLPAGPSPVAVAVGDVNGDGLPDLIVANNLAWPASTPTTPGGFGAAILLGSSTGFSAPVRLPLPAPSVAVASSPRPVLSNVLSGSGLAFAGPNVLSTAPHPSTLVTIFPTGFGGAVTLAPVSVPLPGDNRGLALVELNRDGRIDAVAVQALGANATNASAISVHSILSRPATNSTTAWSYAPLGPFATGLSDAARGIAVGDLNGDGRADVAVAGIRPAGPMLPAFAGGVSVLPGMNNGGFGLGRFFNTGGQPRGIASTDADNDGRRDLVVTDFRGAATLLNNTPPIRALMPSGDLEDSEQSPRALELID